TRIALTGSNFAGGDPQTVTFDGLPASDVTVIDNARIECNLPLGLRPGWVDVAITHAQGTQNASNRFFYTSIEAIAPLSVSAPSSFRMTFPADANQNYQVLVAYGFLGGLPLSQFGNPMDTRVIPINDDIFLRAVVNNQFPQNFANLTGTLDGNGQGTFQVFLPTIQSYIGHFLCFTAVTLDVLAPSGVDNIAEADVYVIQP
ncbi:MAG: hypothetical protein KDB53_01060, partial [Planctomycetes bacterium]|nr:hypothetical protein [Planctomycetota bacterium]